jgi:DNA end-binding protein Ku
MLRVAEHILETKTADFDTAYLEDRYRTVLVDMLRDKQTKLPHGETSTALSRENVINLMDALKRSLVTERPSLRSAPKPTARRTAAASKRSASPRSNASVGKTR